MSIKQHFQKSLFTLFLLSVLVLIYLTSETECTLGKRKGKKEKTGQKPDGVAYNNKKFPTSCHVCRLMVEEINSSLKKGEKEMTEEQIKEKKRKDRRKSKAEKKREKSMPILVAIEDVCNAMLEYAPQDNKTKFRYVKMKDLKDVKVLIKSQEDGEAAGEALEETYDRFRHPETNRLMSMCDEIINAQENNILKWNTFEHKGDLLDYLCRERVFVGEPIDHDSCFEEESAKSSLWETAFDVIFEKHPELKTQDYN
ncbi:uncharacterized protein LOC143461175 [Clavelina lepadiformis]|uniref:DUF3456 domain-containing protein n=1 Tax=Clavelina lepadiformis TaxID=159417 RepID=A0ABP0FV05_CLALP